MYDTWNDPYEIRNLANDKGYRALVKDHARLAARARAAKYCPVEAPGLRLAAPITHIHEPPSLKIPDRGIPTPG